MNSEEYDYEYEAEPVTIQVNRRHALIGGGVIGALLIACLCVLCLVVAFFVGYALRGGAPPEEPSAVPEPTLPPQPTVTAGQAPQPVIVAPLEAFLGEEVSFDGSQSQPGSSPIASYDWNFGDGSTGNGAIVSHIYHDPGTFQVTLTVTGQDGLSSTSSPQQITIREVETPQPTPTSGQPPVPIMRFPPEAAVGEEVPFDGSQSQPGSSPIASYDWDFGDGSTGSGAIVSHIYNAAGTFAVTLTVTGQDGVGNISEPQSIVILGEVPPGSEAPQPVINFPVEAKVGEQVTFDGNESRPGSSPIASYEWDFGDGNTGSGATVTHTYDAAGQFQVTLTVTGQDGMSSTGGPAPVTVSE